MAQWANDAIIGEMGFTALADGAMPWVYSAGVIIGKGILDDGVGSIFVIDEGVLV